MFWFFQLPCMTAYIRFCSRQLSAAKFLQQLTEESADFRNLVKQCQRDPRTNGMPLSSFLIKPMQRITKYPLLIKKVSARCVVVKYVNLMTKPDCSKLMSERLASGTMPHLTWFRFQISTLAAHFWFQVLWDLWQRDTGAGFVWILCFSFSVLVPPTAP
jgi:hypothetical protein